MENDVVGEQRVVTQGEGGRRREAERGGNTPGSNSSFI